MDPTENTPELIDRIRNALVGKDANPASQLLEEYPASEKRLAVSRLSGDERIALIDLLTAEQAVDLLEDLNVDLAAEVVEELPAHQAASLLSCLDTDEQADLLSELEDAEAHPILKALPSEEALEIMELMRYPEDSAGGLMTKEYLAFETGMTVKRVLEDFEQNSAAYTDYEIQYTYIVDPEGKLAGVLRLRDIILSARNLPIEEIMISNPLTVQADADLKTLREFFSEHDFLAVPAVDADGRLRGIVERSAVQRAQAREERGIFLKLSGIMGGEEYRSMPLSQRCFRRLSWLTPNIGLNMLAASVIALYQDTLQAVIALAVFLPIISDMSGCSGNQAVAVSIRELSLGLIRPTEFLRIVFKEGFLGIINGTILGLLLGTAAWVWQQDLLLGAVVAGALSLNTLLAVLLGGTVPLVMRRLKVDPALASGPILTTVTDMCGFFLVLSLASLMLV